MNTTPTMIPPTRSAEPGAAKASEAGAPGTPFSQVLSNEMANSRSSQPARPQTDKAAPQDTAARAEAPATAAPTESAPTDTAASAETPLQEGAAETGGPDAATLLGLALAPVAAPAVAAQAATATEAGAATEAPDTLAQALDPAQRKGRQATARTLPSSAETAGAATQNAEPAGPGKGTPQVGAAASTASTASAAATDAALQAAAAPKESAKPVADGGFEQILHPALRAAAQTLHTPSPGQPVADAAQARLAPAVGSAAWSQALGDRIVWMAGNAQQTATLTLNPPNLGPLQVVLNLSNDQAVASFFAAQPEVRQAIESSFPRLREMMGEAGIQLEQATVSADPSPQQQQDQAAGRPAQGNAPRFGMGDDVTAAVATVATPVRAGRGLVDTFA